MDACAWAVERGYPANDEQVPVTVPNLEVLEAHAAAARRLALAFSTRARKRRSFSSR